MTLITRICLYRSFIINSKVLFITITIINSETSNDTVTQLYTDCESLCAGTYSITIYCGYSLDFIIGYFKAFSNAIFNFDFYGISIDFSDDNSKTSISSIVWFILMILLLQILKHFLLLLQLLILRLLVTLLLDFIPIVRGYLRGPPYTTAPLVMLRGNAPVDDS